MTFHKKTPIITTVLALLLFACNSSKNQELTPSRTTAIELNNRAMNICTNSKFETNPSAKLKEAVLTIDSAIAIDQNYYQLYLNKASILFALKDYETGLETLNTVSLLKKNLVEAISTQGFVYEKLGKYNIAKQYYEKAISIYDQLITENPSNVSAKVNRAFIILLLKGKDSALYTINDILKQHPNDPVAISTQQLISNFDRNSFIQSF